MNNLNTTHLTHPTRESWLQAAVTHLRAMFAAKNFIVPDCQVSCGFASTGVRSGHIGQCWSKKSAANEVNQIFISPTLSSAFEVIDTLTHELVHAVDDCQHKHGKEFKKVALKMGMQGPMRSAGAGPELKAKLNALLEQKAPRVDRPRARCTQCGYQVPMLKRYLSYGPPLCPKHKTDMEPLGDWE
jgi:hypothetical protein